MEKNNPAAALVPPLFVCGIVNGRSDSEETAMTNTTVGSIPLALQEARAALDEAEARGDTRRVRALRRQVQTLEHQGVAKFGANDSTDSSLHRQHSTPCG